MSALLLERPTVRAPGSGVCRHCGRPCSAKEGPCARCRANAPEAASPSSSSVGEIYSYTVVGQGPQAYALALVRLASGRLIMGRIVGGESQLRIGLPVESTAGGEEGPAAAGATLFRVGTPSCRSRAE
jgi:uncharacterized OB-fold protein